MHSAVVPSYVFYHIENRSKVIGVYISMENHRVRWENIMKQTLDTGLDDFFFIKQASFELIEGG